MTASQLMPLMQDLFSNTLVNLTPTGYTGTPASEEFGATVNENKPTSMWDEFLSGSGLNEGAVSKYIANLLGGAGVAERQTAYGQGLTKDVNRTYGGLYNSLTNRMAGSGGRHSSAEAKLLSSGIESYQGSRLAADQQTQAYGDTLRTQQFGQGQAIMGLMTALKQGDITNTMNWLTQLQSVYGLDLSGDQLTALLMSLEEPYADVTTTGNATGQT